MSGYRRGAYSPPSPPHTILLLTVVAIFLVVPSFIAEESSWEILSEVNPVMVMAAPLSLVLIIRWLSSMGKRGGGGVPVGGPYPVRSTSGGSPVGVAIVLLIVLVMVWYQSSGEDESIE